ncbi:MAG: NAD(P)-dependent oxidoreductase [Tenericutes bacterium]|nr:NAD(P)-dependent oxidoreductase [Mycoplasmatota bacterium]
MKVFMIGGTGLLGSLAAKEMISNGHFVTSLALPPIPKGSFIPKEMKLILKDFTKMNDAELSDLFKDCQGFVFEAGIDERLEGKAPIYDIYKKYNIDPLKRLLPLAKRAGVKHSIVLGSYFSYFNREWKDLNLYDNHPYIRSRVDQEEISLSYSDTNMSLSILELPYIFGVQPGRKPVWVFLVEQLRSMKRKTYYPSGGTTMITANQVGKLIANVLEKPDGSKIIPVGYYNLTWTEMLEVFHRVMGIDRRIVSLPKWIYKIALSRVSKDYKKRGLEPGLNMVGLAEIMSRNAYIDKSYIDEYNVPEDDIISAIEESVKLSLEVLDGLEDIIGMKAE